jgi:ankyrin repeat protein
MTNNKGQTPLYIACKRGHKEIITQFMKLPKIPYSTDILISLIRHADLNNIKLLFDRPDFFSTNNINDFLNADHDTALHYAAYYLDNSGNHIPVMEYLIEKGCDINQTNSYNDTPLKISCERKCSQAITMLLNNPTIKRFDKLLFELVINGDLANIKLFLKKLDNDTFSFHKNDIYTLRIAIQRTDNQDSNPYMPILQTLVNNECLKKHINGVYHYDANAKGTLVEYARKNYYIKALELLLATNLFDINIKDCDGNTELHKAIMQENEKAVELYAQYKTTDFNSKNNLGNTPLHVAAAIKERTYKDSKSKIINCIISQCININDKNNAHSTPLHVLLKKTQSPYRDMIKAFLDHPNFDGTLCDGNGNTFLNLAFICKIPYMVPLLLNCDAININHKDHYGNPPLHKIIETRWPYDDIKNIMNRSNLDVLARDSKGDTAFNVAIKSRQNDHINRIKIISALLFHAIRWQPIDSIKAFFSAPIIIKSIMFSVFAALIGIILIKKLKHNDIFTFSAL